MARAGGDHPPGAGLGGGDRPPGSGLSPGDRTGEHADRNRTSRNLPGAARSSAEAIAEAPCCTAGGGILPLTNFGTVSFNSATASGRSMATYNPTEIVMPDTFVSPMNSAGNFMVSYAGFPGFPGFPRYPVRSGSGPVSSGSD